MYQQGNMVALTGLMLCCLYLTWSSECSTGNVACFWNYGQKVPAPETVATFCLIILRYKSI